MAENQRIFYACQAVAIQPHGRNLAVNTNEMVHGVQSIGITTNFNLEQAFELGQIEIYENIEGTPDIEVTLEKVLDGNHLIYHMATNPGLDGSVAGSGLAGRSKVQCDVRLGIFDDDKNFVGGVNDINAPAEVYMSGMYISSISYNLGTDGNHTESVTFVGNNKKWYFAGGGHIDHASVNAFDGTDDPKGLGDAANPSGGISQKEDVLLSGCILPVSIDNVLGTTSTYSNGVDRVHLQSVTVSTDFSREDIFELGRKTPYARPAAFPIEVTCDIECIAISGDRVEGHEDGDYSLYATTASGNNTTNEDIFFLTRNGLGLDLGNKNRLSSVSYGGGDAGGGNATITYSYQNFNDLDVQHFNQYKHNAADGTGHVGFNLLSNGTGKDSAGNWLPQYPGRIG